jgi:hypothetical protein
MAKQDLIAEHNLLVAKRTGILAEISSNRQKFDNQMSIARMKQGQDAEEAEQEATKTMIGSIEKLSELEGKFRTAMASGKGFNPLSMGMSPDDVKQLGMSPGEQGPDQLKQLADQMRQARNAQAMILASRTGNTGYIVPGSKEQSLMVNRWIPAARTYLQANMMMNEISARKGPLFAANMVNKIAAIMAIAETSDPDIAAAMARASGGGSMGQQGAPGAQQPGSQPSAQPGSRPGGSGISIPRDR